MSDLISRKALLEVFESHGFNQDTMIPIISLMKVLEIIDNQPTAYDVDKVVEQLEAERHVIGVNATVDTVTTADYIEGYNDSINGAIRTVKEATHD